MKNYGKPSSSRVNLSPAMSKSFSALRDNLIQLSEPVRESLYRTEYKPPEATNVSIKSILESLLPPPSPTVPNPDDIHTQIRDFSLCCALLSSAEASSSDLLTWIPKELSITANLAFQELSKSYFANLDVKQSKWYDELGMDYSLMSDEKKLVIELMPEVLLLLKGTIKESSIDHLDDGNEVSAASARVPTAYAIVAAYQFRWFVTQVDYPHLGKLCFLVIPCALTVLDHWSSEVKGQGMTSFIHLAKNVNAADLGLYEDVILDTCCQNIASSDEIWHLVVEMSVRLVTCTQRSNPRSPWYERMLNEMLSHLERQPRSKERRIAWLEFAEPLLNGAGLVLLAHFKRIFPLFLKWMHADDDQTVLLVLKRFCTVIEVTWIRKSPYVERLVDELAVIYKEASLRRAREEIRTHVVQTLTLLQECKGLQFEAAWDKYRDDPNLTALGSSFSGRTTTA